MNLAVNGLSLTFAVTLVFVALVISFHEKIGLEKDMIISVFRAIIQLFIVGYLLKFIFHINDVWLTLLMMLIIIFNAAANAKKRAGKLRNGFPISFIAILTSTGVTLGLLVLSGAIKFIPSQIIPITGMIASNSMVAIGLSYRSLLAGNLFWNNSPWERPLNKHQLPLFVRVFVRGCHPRSIPLKRWGLSACQGWCRAWFLPELIQSRPLCTRY